MTASHDATINLEHLNVPSHIPAAFLPTLVIPLFSLGQLCDNGVDYLILDKNYISILVKGKRTTIGKKYHMTDLWNVELNNSSSVPAPHQPLNFSHSAYAHKTRAELIDFLHCTCFSPTTST